MGEFQTLLFSPTSFCRFIHDYINRGRVRTLSNLVISPTSFVGLSTIVKCAGVPNCQCLIATRSAYFGTSQALISIPLFGRHLHCVSIKKRWIGAERLILIQFHPLIRA